MSQWDAEEHEESEFTTRHLITDKWEGEDEDDDVKDNWDDDEEEDSVEQDQKKDPSIEVKAVQVKKKNTTKKIKEKEDRRKEPEIKQQEEVPPPTTEELLQEKLRRQKLQEESDLELAKEAFGISELRTGIDSMEPTSKDEFDALRKALIDKLTKYEKAALYLPFLDDLFRELCINLDADDIKKLGSTLNALSSEKVKAARASKAKKKGSSTKKASLVVGKPTEFDYDYGGGAEYGDEFDDFM